MLISWVTGLQDTCGSSILGLLQIKWLQAHEVSLTVPTPFFLYPLGNRALEVPGRNSCGDGSVCDVLAL